MGKRCIAVVGNHAPSSEASAVIVGIAVLRTEVSLLQVADTGNLDGRVERFDQSDQLAFARLREQRRKEIERGS